MAITRSIPEINEQLDKAMEGIENGTKYGGMSYEDGVRAAIEWMLGDMDEKPME